MYKGVLIVETGIGVIGDAKCPLERTGIHGEKRGIPGSLPDLV
jgi:hypothetical protein